MAKKLVLALAWLVLVGCAQPASPANNVDSDATVDMPESEVTSEEQVDQPERRDEDDSDQNQQGRDDDDDATGGERVCPDGWQQRIENAANDPAACPLPPGICKQIARGKDIPPGIRRNAEACGLDVDALLAGG